MDGKIRQLIILNTFAMAAECSANIINRMLKINGEYDVPYRLMMHEWLTCVSMCWS